MERTLGLDLGTNSIGWAIVDSDGDYHKLIDKGVCIFQEGVARSKGEEKPMVQQRTQARALRRHYFRRRLRKIETLKVLVENGMCPFLSEKQLAEWKSDKKYPLSDDFILWQRTDDNVDKNPYSCRHTALNEALDLTKRENRYLLGRAFYHLSQRRGFLSNRKACTKETEGDVKKSISELNARMREAGFKYLGDYFYYLYGKKDKIRKSYTSRIDHYMAEFEAICVKQSLPESVVVALRKAIFYQRELKSQKGLVGKCTFEKKKSRCPVSHPRFEEFRMLSFVNNIRIKTPYDDSMRPLNADEREKVVYKICTSKNDFDFEAIAKLLVGRKEHYSYFKDGLDTPYVFNYRAGTSVPGCPVIAGFCAVMGVDWEQYLMDAYTYRKGKDNDRIVNDIWHVLFSFGDDDKLKVWAEQNLGFSEKQSVAFTKIKIRQDYASLSLNAINKMLPYMRMGRRYDEAVFLANLSKVLPDALWNDDNERAIIENGVLGILRDYNLNPLNKGKSKEECVRGFLMDNFDLSPAAVGKLYHPSMIETYPKMIPDKNGVIHLGSPRTSSVRNPMAMRSLFRLRHLINALLDEGEINRNTKINIEFSRGLNDSNKRRAIEDYQRDRERERQKNRIEIINLFRAETNLEIEPTERDLLKYQLWKEQNHKCLYTGNEIRISDFLGVHPIYDIEHTVPRSLGGDDSQMNKTLCELKFNRFTKKGRLPSHLAEYQNILSRIEALGWKEKIDALYNAEQRTKGYASTKEQKDANIRKRHYLRMQRDYLKGKFDRFFLKEVPQGFTNRQGVDIGIIGRYARLYLETVFERIYTVKGATTAEFRKMWGLQGEYERKERVNHIHHCIDAVTIACIGRKEYDLWAQFNVDTERYETGNGSKPVFPKPWDTFTQDVKNLANEVLVSHYGPNNLPKQSRRLLRVKGKIQYNSVGKPIYIQGDTARGSLHMQTFYGAINRGEGVKYVVRKSLVDIQASEVDRIVDDVVRQKVKDAVLSMGFKDAISGTIWMNEDKQIPIRKVRLYVPSVVSPIHLKEQRDLSHCLYKRNFYVANESNYAMALYEGMDDRGKIRRSFLLISNLEAAQYYKLSQIHQDGFVPLSDNVANPLKYVLKVGMLVLFYDKSKEELAELPISELSKRMYKLVGMSQMRIQQYRYGTLMFKHHQEARPSSELKEKKGAFVTDESYRPVISVLHSPNQFKAMVEGYDFDLSLSGKITFR